MASGARQHPDIPLLPAPLIGREADLRLGRQLFKDGARLLTLTGPPGVGKTSLALALAADQAAQFSDGVSLIDLSAVIEPELVAVRMADTLGALGRRRPADRLVAMLRHRQFLLLLDNFEQVVSAARVVSELLTACPGLRVIVTSRIALRVRWEHELPVPPLALPATSAALTAIALAQAPAARLFIERARRVNPAFSVSDRQAVTVARLCVRLDGLPLAIELAAARSRTQTPAAILADLGETPGVAGDRRALDALTHGPRDLPARQQTLRDAVAWSHALLGPDEQQLFRRLAVFAGGCTLQAAAHVCDAAWPDLESLVEKSLLRLDTSAAPDPDTAEPRARMLELVRAYALEQLAASDEWEALRTRHLRWAVALAEAAEPHLTGPQQDQWLARLDRERENLRAATRWATESGDTEATLRLGAALLRFWRARGDAEIVREHVTAILALADSAPALPAAVRAFEGTGELAGVVGEYAAAQRLYERSREIARQLGDRRGEAVGLRRLAQLAGFRGQYAEADRLGRESLAILERLDDPASLADTLRELGMLSYFAGDHVRARQLLEQSGAIDRRVGDQWRLADALFGLALSDHATGEVADARHLYDQCLILDRALGNRAAEGSVLNNLGHLATMQGDLPAARSLLRESLLASADGGDRRRQAFTLSAVAVLAAVEQQPLLALQLDAAGLAALDAIGATLAPPMRALYDAQLQGARQRLGESEALAAADAGRFQTLEQAVSMALEWLAGTSTAGEACTDASPSAAEEAGPSAAVPATLSRSASPSRQPTPARPAEPPATVLTPRERDVAALVARGLTNREIAAALVVTEGTAANYVQRVLTRLNMNNRAQVAAWAVQHGLNAAVAPDDPAY